LSAPDRCADRAGLGVRQSDHSPAWSHGGQDPSAPGCDTLARLDL
jgi:hypothetical protein